MSVYIRPIELGDAVEVLRWENDVDNWSSSNNDSPYQLWDIVRLIESLSNIEVAKQARWIICDSDNGKALGAVDLCEIDFESKEAIVGILIADKENRQKGSAHQSLQLIEHEAIKLGVEKLTCMIHPENKPSLALFQKCNFNKIGQSDDKYLSDGVYIEALLFEKWLKK
jgi:diamine N-acetyltransferase